MALEDLISFSVFQYLEQKWIVKFLQVLMTFKFWTVASITQIPKLRIFFQKILIVRVTSDLYWKVLLLIIIILELGCLHKQHTVLRYVLQRYLAAQQQHVTNDFVLTNWLSYKRFPGASSWTTGQGITVLDSGCGPGAWTIDISEKYIQNSMVLTFQMYFPPRSLITANSLLVTLLRQFLTLTVPLTTSIKDYFSSLWQKRIGTVYVGRPSNFTCVQHEANHVILAK